MNLFTMTMLRATLGRSCRTVLTFGPFFALLHNASAQSSNDACGLAVANRYTVNSSCTFQAFNKPGSYTSSGMTPAGCNGSNNDDAFGWFQATSTTTIITFDPTNNHDAILHVFSGACASLTVVGCSNVGGNGVNESVTITTTVGTNYQFRVQRNGTDNNMDGSICVYDGTPPANNDPCGAVSLTVNSSCTNTAATNVNATGTTGVPAPTCASYSGGDVWFSFVAPAGGITTMETGANGMTNSGMELYSATNCSTGFTSVACDDNAGAGDMSLISSTTLTAGATYYLRVWGSGGATGTFNICVYNVVPPANDDPCTAIALTTSTSCTLTSYTNVNGTTTPSIPAPGCGNFSGSRDVWFTVVAPSTGVIKFESTVGTLTDPSMALYAATSCSGPFTLVECDANDGVGNAPYLLFYDLVPGATYYLRVWGDGTSTGTFNLCAEVPATTGDCFYILNMFDNAGDGWGGSTVGVSINGGGYTNYTLSSGNRGAVFIPVSMGDIIVLNYTAAGGAQGEIVYALQSGNGALFSAGPTPGVGVVYSHTNDCVPATPPREDCTGAYTVCGSSTISSSPNNTGLKADLNIQNRGCLSSDERQGTWYVFSPSAPGTLEFTIVPTNAGDDYDFAVWGPSTSLSCPPTTTPYRCSYSGSTGNTGLLVGSGDVTEGSGGDKFVNGMDVAVGEIYVLYVSNYSQSGLSFDLNWNLIGGASLDCTVLPIELLNFQAKAGTTDVLVDWATATESENAYFVVERSTDGEVFTGLGQVQGAGTSFSTIAYNFVDKAPLRGNNYYRLKQVDTDGNFSYSQVAVVHFGVSLASGTPYPNPANGHVNVMVTATHGGTAQLNVVDASGRTVRSLTATVREGEQVLTAPIADLEPGSYILALEADDGTPVMAGRFVVE